MLVPLAALLINMVIPIVEDVFLTVLKKTKVNTMIQLAFFGHQEPVFLSETRFLKA